MDKEDGGPGRSAGTISRYKNLSQLTRAAERLSRRLSRRVWRPNFQALHKLTQETAELPAERPLTIGELRVWSATAKRLYRRQCRVETLVLREQGAQETD